ncbi:phosphoribosylglycinamide formyltransferase [Granulicella cerasi]|uniref:Phosphoribosylglycinamide formyltransferase n=1 Tax=Granulicella cerasi TaxID=741063 RepID=A0ABW1Z4Z3_9BACT|nr:phosphoribosylglycinamide formyltransferase [Granulicella cerasi]
MSQTPLKVAVLGSTRGTAMQGLLNAIREKSLDVELVLVLSDRENAGILERAQLHNVPSLWIPAKGVSREAWEAEATKALRAVGADLVLMIGFMRIVTPQFVNDWRGKLLNVHPSLLPLFAGGMNMDVHAAVLAAGVDETGCTIHHVTEEVDGGPIVLQMRCPVLPGDTPETLKDRVQALEQQAFVEVLRHWSKR